MDVETDNLYPLSTLRRGCDNFLRSSKSVVRSAFAKKSYSRDRTSCLRPREINRGDI